MFFKYTICGMESDFNIDSFLLMQNFSYDSNEIAISS